jgi:hypothetical protein
MLVTYDSNDGGIDIYQTQPIQLDVSGGTLPSPIQIRQSPTLSSNGETTVKAVNCGYMISSFFDIFTEVSTDGGATWTPAASSSHVELMIDPTTVLAMSAASNLLPSPMAQTVAVPPWPWQTYASGIVINNFRQILPTNFTLPPGAGQTTTHTFDSQLDFQLSTDGGQTFQPVRAPATCTVRNGWVRTFNLCSFFDTEMLQLDIAGGDLPAGVMIRESPTKVSQGGISITTGSGYMISSFFDIFTEVSTDGGESWSPATSGPGHLLDTPLLPDAIWVYPDPVLMQPPGSEYYGLKPYFASFANGIQIANFFERNYSQSFLLPPPGQLQVENYSCIVKMLVSIDGGQTYSRAQAPATVTIQDSSLQDAGNTRYFDTEITSLNISGGNLPSGVMIRESPTRASKGRYCQFPRVGGGYQVDSFFDIYIEVSTNGGKSWYPTTIGPARVLLRPSSCSQCTDYDGTGLTDFKDFAILTNNWRWEETLGDAVNSQDNDCDGIVDMKDLAMFADNWLQSCS